MSVEDADDVATLLEEIAMFLEAQGSREAYNYTEAANAVHHATVIPANPAELDGIGPKMRDVIEDIRVYGTHERLEHLRDEYPHLKELTKVDGVGPVMAKRLGEAGFGTPEDLVGEQEALMEVHGIGFTTAEKISTNAESLK